MTVSFKEQHWNRLIYSSIAEVNIWPCIAPVTSSSAAKRSRWSSEEWVSPHLSIQGRAVPLPGGFGTSKEKEICTVCGLYKSCCLEQKLCKYLRGNKVCCCGETGTARLSSLPNALLVLFSVFKDGFLQLWCGPTAPAKKRCAGGDPAQLPSSELICPASLELGCLFLQAVPVWSLLKGRECRVALCFLFTFFPAYLQSDQDVTIFEVCEPMSAEKSGCFGVVFKSRPHSTRQYGIWWMEGLVEVCICWATGSIMQVEWYLHGDNALPRDLTPSNTYFIAEPSALSSCTASQYSFIQRGV